MTASKQPLYGAIEAGGTKFVLAIGHAPDKIVARHIIPTTSPDETLGAAQTWFAAHGALTSLGIASFGPLELNKSEKNWGSITNTPKPGWQNCALAQYFQDALQCPIVIDTDVNGAALGEYHFGAGQGVSCLIYVTIGTGIGGGAIINGQPLQGFGHPEMGHIFPRRSAHDMDYKGHCPVHGDCLEGLASGPAIAARWGGSLSQLPQDHEAHDMVASYLAQLCHDLTAIIAAERIILGGGVMHSEGLLDRIVTKTQALSGGYFTPRPQPYICKAGLVNDAGIMGALLLAQQAAA